ncbi:MAG: addiction module protein [Gemmatimonadetes bacterium]|nr:addiction module protein [Gemmatimonadota bacterium]
MNDNLDALKAAVLALPSEQLAELIDEAITKISDPGPLSDAWKAELDRRGREIDEGTVELIDNEDVFAYVRSRLR